MILKHVYVNFLSFVQFKTSHLGENLDNVPDICSNFVAVKPATNYFC